jgi:heptosyltransferase-2
LLAGEGIGGPYTVLCPGVVGVHHGRPKAWDGFPRLCRSLLAAGIRVVAVPGPGERATVEVALPGGRLLNETDVGTFAALLAGAQLVVANDSGPSHVAAAVGAPLVAVFGVTDPARTRPWTHDADLVGGPNGWPDFESVWQRVCERLQLGDAPPAPA